jgi:hypothetical protein
VNEPCIRFLVVEFTNVIDCVLFLKIVVFVAASVTVYPTVYVPIDSFVETILTVEPRRFPISLPAAVVVKLLLAASGGAFDVKLLVFTVKLVAEQPPKATDFIVTVASLALGLDVVKVPVPGEPAVNTTDADVAPPLSLNLQPTVYVPEAKRDEESVTETPVPVHCKEEAAAVRPVTSLLMVNVKAVEELTQPVVEFLTERFPVNVPPVWFDGIAMVIDDPGRAAFVTAANVLDGDAFHVILYWFGEPVVALYVSAAVVTPKQLAVVAEAVIVGRAFTVVAVEEVAEAAVQPFPFV